MTAVFFYGLFMDEGLLRKKGLHPSSTHISYVENYGLRIGDKATLIPAEGERAYGTVMELDDAEIDALYSEQGVEEYRPEPVTAITLENQFIPAIVYNLPKEKLSGQNNDYLHSLIAIARKTGLPDEYLGKLKKMEAKA